MTRDPGVGPEPGVPLAAEVRELVTYQSYARAPQIAGVWARPVRKHRAENGWFAELLRLSDGDVDGADAPMVVRQLSASHAAPGRINAFHIHPRRGQNELWTVLQGQLMVWLVDCRADSETRGVRQRVVLSGEEPQQLYIPAGVAHGYRSGGEGALLVYAMDQQFDPADPDEGRLPWNHFGADLWEEDRG